MWKQGENLAHRGELKQRLIPSPIWGEVGAEFTLSWRRGYAVDSLERSRLRHSASQVAARFNTPLGDYFALPRPVYLCRRLMVISLVTLLMHCRLQMATLGRLLVIPWHFSHGQSSEPGHGWALLST